MNECLGVAPRCFETAHDLRYLLERLGPFEGRYAASFPGHWKREACNYAESLPEVESTRVKELIRRHYDSAFIGSARKYDGNQSWTENVRKVQRSPEPFDGVVGDITEKSEFATVRTLDISQLPGARDWRGPATVENFDSLGAVVISQSPEVLVIDPYFNCGVEANASVLRAFLRRASRAKCTRITIWARGTEVLGRGGRRVFEANTLDKLKDSPLPKDGLRVFLFDDSMPATREHARYLLSQRGALRFDSGFRAFTDGTAMDVAIVDRTVHAHLVEKFILEKGCPPNVESFLFR